jgi:hypothetical protein
MTLFPPFWRDLAGFYIYFGGFGGILAVIWRKDFYDIF